MASGRLVELQDLPLISPIQRLQARLINLLDLIIPLPDHLLHHLMRLVQFIDDDQLAQLHLAMPLLRVTSCSPHILHRAIVHFLRFRAGLGAGFGCDGRDRNSD